MKEAACKPRMHKYHSTLEFFQSFIHHHHQENDLDNNLPADAPRQLHVLGEDRHPLGVDRAQVRVLLKKKCY
jgi:hypothetical protein